MPRANPKPAPDYNAAGKYWTPIRSQDQDPPLSVNLLDGELLPLMPTTEDFKRQIVNGGLDRLPTGVHQYARVRLSTLFPELQAVTLGIWYRLPRIRCCGFLSLTPDGELDDCGRCLNHGYVCPTCTGHHVVKIYTPKPVAVPCPSCTWDGVYREERERRAVELWLERNWPMGVHDGG